MFLTLFTKSLLNNLNSKIVIILLLPLLSTYQEIHSQQDSTKPVQYRRVIELQEGYQSYEEKYAGKNLNEEKRSLFPLESTGVWTELNPKVPRVDYIGVHFVNPDLPTGQAGTGWACGDLGALIKTTNGGESWTVSQTNTTTPILKVRSYNGQTVIASGYDGLILRSIDGGETFTQITSGVTGDLWGLEIVNETLGWACGTTTLLKTIDGGVSWQIVNTPGYTGNLWSVEFLTENYGFIAADGKVLRTTDGGDNWEIIQAGDNQALYIVDIIDSLHIAAAGYGGTSYRGKNLYSSDGGFTWITGGPLTFEQVNDIKYVNRDTGYVVLNNTIGFKTTNHGQQWTAANSVGGDWEMQFLTEQNIGYSVGTGLRIYKTENSFENWHRLIINDNFSDVFFTSDNKGFALGKILYRTTDGGNKWQSNGPGGSCVYFIDSLTGFIGNPGGIWKTTDEGDNWYQTNGSNGASKIFFVNENIGWATRNNIIYKTTDKGENWFTQFTAPSSIFFTGIYFVDSLYGWTAGRRPYKTTDGGNNWVQQTNTNIWLSDDVYFYNYLKGWIIVGNRLYYSHDGGNDWIQDPQIYTYSRNFETISNTHFIITGTNIYESVDTGQVWQNITIQVGSYFTALYAPKNYLAYGVGPLGYIVSYLDNSLIPVELINFSAEQLENKILLRWVTATETNNYGFEILRSHDRIKWDVIGFVTGNGSTTSTVNYSFFDTEIIGDRYYYKLKRIDYDGSYEFSEIVTVNIPIDYYFLYQNYPNPANPTTTISFSIPQKTVVKMELFSITGEKITEILNEEKDKGIYKIDINLSNYASGIYFYKMITKSGYTATKKITLAK